MLHCALEFRQVFPRFAFADSGFTDYVPASEDWERVERVCDVLSVFEEATKIVSGSEYPTSNLFLSEIRRVKQVIDNKVSDPDYSISQMAEAMKYKFDKYWKESNLMMSIGAVMDPRLKMDLPKFCFSILYPLGGEAEKKLNELDVVLHELYAEYVANESMKNGTESRASNQVSSSDKSREQGKRETLAGLSEFESYMLSTGANLQPLRTELDEYLAEKNFIFNETSHNFDALTWWKIHSAKYPVLSKMTRDMLAVPISTVASESAFSAGGRVIEPHRSCLKTETVEMLMCGADWAREIYGLKKSGQFKELSDH